MNAPHDNFDTVSASMAAALVGAELTEEMVLAWVEGEADAGVSARIEAAMLTDAALATWLIGLRTDRRGIAALGEVCAPAGLLEGVERRREAAALAALADGDPVLARLPVSRVGVVRKPMLTSRQWRGLAMAAGFAMAIGGAAYLASMVSLPRFGGGPQRESGPIAKRGQPEAPERVAVIDEGVERVPVESGTGGGVEEGMMVARAPAENGEAGAAPTLSMREAVALAAERRLTVRVVFDDVARFDARASGVARAGRVHEGWVIASRAPMALAQAVMRDRAVDARASRVFESPLAMFFASREAPLVVRAPRIGATSSQPPSVVYLAETRLDERAFVAMLSELSFPGATVEIQVLESPWDVAHVPASIESVLWWTGDPANWAPWAAVPIVIEVAP